MPRNCAALNCDTGYAGRPKEDGVALFRFPMKNEDLLRQWLSNLNPKFLWKAVDFMDEWRKSGLLGLTLETFTAVSHTCRTLVELSRYCLTNLDFEAVFFGKFQSDRLEGRFSAYRQMSGGNYYISVRQILENERKIRVGSLLKLTGMSIEGLKALGDDVQSEPDEEEVHRMAQEVAETLEGTESPMDCTHANLLFFVAGYAVKSETSRSGCESCKELLLENSRDGRDPHSERGRRSRL